MKQLRRTVFRAAIVGLSTLAVAGSLAGTALAQDYPSKPVRFLIGAGPDGIARLVAENFTSKWGVQVNVERIPGATGLIALETLANSPPDGHTFLYMTGAYMLNEALRPEIGVKLSSLEPIGQVGVWPFILMVHPDVPANTLDELIEHSRANPGKLRCTSAGVTGPIGVGCEMLKAYADLDIVHVPYKTFGAALTDLVAGRTHLTFGIGPALTYAEEGKLRPLAITGPERLPNFPDVPTVAEAGFEKLGYISTAGLTAPDGTPPEIVDKINSDLNEFLRSDKFKAIARKFGFTPAPKTPAAYTQYVQEELATWQRIVEDTGISVQ